MPRAIRVIDPTTPSQITDLSTALDAFAVNPEIPANALSVVGYAVVRGFR